MEMGWLIWLTVMGTIIFAAGMALIFADALDGFSVGLASTGVGILFIAIVAFAGMSPVFGRDADGRFSGSQLKPWFDSLKSGKGPCCSDADGTALSDVDWESKGSHYRVRIDDQWWDVPDEAVITVPNLIGRTMVWPIRYNYGAVGMPLKIEIRCFMPGSMT